MKILIAATGVFSKGGIQRYVRYQYRALEEIYGQDNIYLTSLVGKEEENAFEEEIDTVYVQGGKSMFDKITFVIKCVVLARRHKVDVIISTLRQLAVLGYIARTFFGIKYVSNVYGLEIWSGMNNLERFCLLRSDKILGDCNFILDYIEKHLDYPRGNMELLFDPVDLERFVPTGKNEKLYSKYQIPKDKFCIATIGQLERNKGHETIIKTLPKLEQSVIYLVIGGGRLMTSLKALAEEMNVVDRVVFTGRVPEDELVDFYNLSDVVVLLSTFGRNEGEGLPLGLIEASGCGKPIICGNEDGSQDAISSNYPNGYLIEPQNQNALELAVNRYIHYPDKLKEHGDNGRKYVVEQFAFDKFKAKQEMIVRSFENEQGR